jgi:H+/Cl- antiporter ClcA
MRLLIIVTQVATGLMGAAMMWLLHAVQRVAFGYHHGTFGPAVAHASPQRRLFALVIAGVIAGPAWYALRRATAGQNSDLDDELWTGTGDLSFRRSLGTSVLSEMVVGAGTPLGREAAPKLMGGRPAACSRGGGTSPRRNVICWWLAGAARGWARCTACPLAAR